MAITRVNFADNPTAAFTVLDLNCVDLDSRVTVAKSTADSAVSAAAAAQATANTANTTANNAFPKAGGALTGGLSAVQNIGSSTNTLVLYSSGGASGQVLIRPQGAGSSAGQNIFGPTGLLGTPGIMTRTAANSFLIDWSGGQASLYLDGASKIGVFSFATSDPRLKRDVVYLDSEADGDADQAKVLAGRPCTWYFKDIQLWEDDGTQYRSFLSPEMQDIDPLLAPGDRNAVNEDGIIQPLNLSNDAIVSVLWGALRREIQLRQSLETRVAALEAPSS